MHTTHSTGPRSHSNHILGARSVCNTVRFGLDPQTRCCLSGRYRVTIVQRSNVQVCEHRRGILGFVSVPCADERAVNSVVQCQQYPVQCQQYPMHSQRSQWCRSRCLLSDDSSTLNMMPNPKNLHKREKAAATSTFESICLNQRPSVHCVSGAMVKQVVQQNQRTNQVAVAARRWKGYWIKRAYLWYHHACRGKRFSFLRVPIALQYQLS